MSQRPITARLDTLHQEIFPPLPTLPEGMSYAIVTFDDNEATATSILVSAYVTACAIFGEWTLISADDHDALIWEISKVVRQVPLSTFGLLQSKMYLDSRDLYVRIEGGFVAINPSLVHDSWKVPLMFR